MANTALLAAVILWAVGTSVVRAQVADGQLIQTPDGMLYVVQDGQLHAVDPTPMEFQQVFGVPVGAPVTTGVQIISSAAPLPAPVSSGEPPIGTSSEKFVDERGSVTNPTSTFDEVLRSERFVPAVSRVQVCREAAGTFSGSNPQLAINLTQAATLNSAGGWNIRSAGSQCATVAVGPDEPYFVTVNATGFQGQWHVTVEPAP